MLPVVLPHSYNTKFRPSGWVEFGVETRSKWGRGGESKLSYVFYKVLVGVSINLEVCACIKPLNNNLYSTECMESPVHGSYIKRSINMGKNSDCFQLYCDSLCVCLPKLRTLRLAYGEHGFIFLQGCLRWKMVCLWGKDRYWACLTLNLLTTTIVAPPSNASKWQMGFNSAFKGLK